MKGVALRLSLASLLLIVGCAKTIVVSGIEVHERQWNNAVDSLSNRAAYELECAPEQLSFVLLHKQARYPTQVGVEGCGNRVVYIRLTAGGVLGSWTLESSNR